jgi:hypothetical protein
MRKSRKDAFGDLGITLRNRSSISGRNERLGVSGMSLWQHELCWRDGALYFERLNWDGWSPRAKRAVIRDLQYARDHLGGIVHLVVSVRDWTAPNGVVRVAHSFARPNVRLRITYLNPETGAFRLEQVVPVIRLAA